jgi:hypothetical protein
MRLCRAVLLVATVWAMQRSRADAHFLFIRILPPAEGGRAGEVFFSDRPDTGDPRHIDKITSTQLWVQSAPGRFGTLEVHRAADRLRAWLPESGSVVVAGSCTYGVVARQKQAPFLLRHFPKAMAGTTEELNRMEAFGKLPLEIVATIEDDHLTLVAQKHGKPVPRAEFVTVDSGLANTKVTADESGKASWKPPSAGAYAVYVQDTRKEAGTQNGQAYEEVRDFATLAFTWPLERKDPDPAAVALFEEAIAARAAWQDFPGFTARLAGSIDGRRFAGKVSIDAAGTVSFTDDSVTKAEDAAKWVRDQLESIVLHRMAQPARPGRPKPVLWFGDTGDDNPLGRLLVFGGGKFASSYRVKDRQLTVVNRVLAKGNMTILTLENERNADDHFLPRSYVVQHWQSGTGRLLRLETVQDRWQRVGTWDLPASHSVTSSSDSGLSVRTFTLSRHELLPAK